MVIFLPHEIEGLSALEAHLFSTDIRSILGDLSRAKVEVRIPKFKMEKFVDMNESLKKVRIRKRSLSLVQSI